MMKKLLFVYNPHAGKGRIGAQLDKIVSAFDKEDYEVTLRPPRGKGDATRIFRENAGLYDRFLVSGGDGTLNEAVSGLIAAAEEGISIPELGYLPAGSTNDFASSLKIPTQIPKAIQVAARGTPFPCDAGSLNGTPYVYVAAFGAFTEVSYATPQQTKNALGHLAYILEGVRSLPQIKGIPMEVTVNGDYGETYKVVSIAPNAFKGIKKLTKVTIGKNVKMIGAKAFYGCKALKKDYDQDEETHEKDRRRESLHRH